MNIFSASKTDYTHIHQFLIPYEHTCVLLASYVRKESEHIFVISQKSSISNPDDIFGVIYLDKTLLHCIPNASLATPNAGLASPTAALTFPNTALATPTAAPVALSELTSALHSFLSVPEHKVKCINGEKSVSDFICSILSQIGQQPAQANTYQLMTLETSCQATVPPESLSNGDEIIRCTEHDIDLLLDLQKKYLIKEVAPAGKQVTDLECRLSLKQILKNQLCFALYADGEIVAKANTNAIGLHWIQIGGVFTHPLYRRNHYAWHLVYTLCRRIQKTNRNICLFVKDRNNPARELYKRIGFKEICSFEIVYF